MFLGLSAAEAILEPRYRIALQSRTDLVRFQEPALGSPQEFLTFQYSGLQQNWGAYRPMPESQIDTIHTRDTVDRCLTSVECVSKVRRAVRDRIHTLSHSREANLRFWCGPVRGGAPPILLQPRVPQRYRNNLETFRNIHFRMGISK